MGSCQSSDLYSSQDQKGGKIPLMELVCTNCPMNNIALDQTTKLKAVIIADSHLGKIYPVEPTIPKLLKYVQKVVDDNNANCVFWLGDIFDTKAKNEIQAGQKFIDTFSSFSVPIHFVSGNHDRFLYKKLNINGSIHYCPSKIMKIESQTAQESIFFGHDLGNSYKLSNQEVPSFIWSNKYAQKKIIPFDNWFIIGHTHFLYVNKEKKIASLAPFSVDLNTFCYGLIVDGENGFEVTFHNIQTKSSVASLVSRIEGGKNEEEENE